MNNNLPPSHDHQPQPREIPKLTADELIAHIRPHCEARYEPEINRMTLGAYLDELLATMNTEHPSLPGRFSQLIHRINEGLGGSTTAMTPDVKNLSNCLIVGYGMVRTAYDAHKIPIPPDITQQPWFEHEHINTVADLFEEVNVSQIRIVEAYPDLAYALQAYIDLSQSHANSTYAYGMATTAAAELYDAFTQMEATRV